ncbi:MAG: OsmC family protein [Methylococcales bacterium]|nr:OsmC family protein [Methylococcales bacterium]
MEATVKWVDGRMFVGETGSGHAVIMDGSADHGGRNMGIRPMEMILLGVGGCSSFDVIEILQKGRHNVSNCKVEITAERVDAIPSVFSKIHLHFVVIGNELKETVVARAVKLSAEKYCSASIMLSKSVEITHDFEVKNAGDDERD